MIYWLCVFHFVRRYFAENYVIFIVSDLRLIRLFSLATGICSYLLFKRPYEVRGRIKYETV